MNILIDKSVTGSKYHLRCDDSGSYQFVDNIDEDEWYYGPKYLSMCISSVIEASMGELPVFPPDRYRNAWTIASSGSNVSPPWPVIIPREQYTRYLKDTVGLIFEGLNSAGSYYVDMFLKNRKFLMNLDRAYVDVNMLNDLIKKENNGSIIENLLKFLPKDDDHIERTTYSQTGSVTGRLTVIRGPNILTLKKSHRSILKSSYRNGGIYMIDLVSLEPRICCLISGNNPPRDIYGDFCKNYFPSLSRGEAKLSIIGTLYGMSHSTLKKKVSDKNNSRAISRAVKDFFKIGDIEARIKDEHACLGYIKNHFGRKIYADSPVFNHFVQSTGVDVSIRCFEKILDKIRNLGCDARPLFVIHDAIVIDANHDFENISKEICDDPISIDEMKGDFYISCDRLS